MKLKPLGDRLIVTPIEEEETTASGIVLPDTAKEKPQRGKVLAVGDGIDAGLKSGPRLRVVLELLMSHLSNLLRSGCS